MITFDNWTIKAGGLIARQYDNLSRRIDIEGDIPAGWTWALLTQCGDQLNIITLTEADGGLYAVLTAEMLALSGYYYIQLQGTQGDVVKHTNIIQVYIPRSLSGNVQWPTVPSEFTQVEQRIQTLNSNPPYPGDDGYWMIYDIDSGAYIQSFLPLPPVAEGPPGKAATITVGETTTGQPGTEANVENVGTSSDAVLRFTIPAGQNGNPGAAATVTVGTTATGEPGTEATVQNTGTENAAILNFTIPAGRDGTPGVTPNISATASDLPAGSNPTVEVSGSPESPVIAFGIPAGRTGKNGFGVPIPRLTDAGKVPAVNKTGDGYDLVEIGGSSVDNSPFEILVDDEITEPAAYNRNDFDKNKSEYLVTILVPKVENKLSSANASVFGSPATLYYITIGDTTYPHGTVVYTKKAGENQQLQFRAVNAGMTDFNPNTVSNFGNVAFGVFNMNVNQGVSIPATLPTGTKIRIEGR